METHQRELLVARVVSGCIRIRLPSRQVYLIRRPGRECLYEAQEVYADHLRDAELDGLFSDEELYDYLLDAGLWDESRDSLLKGLPKEIEEFKLRLFKAEFRGNERRVVRAALARAKEKLAELEAERHSMDHLSCAGYASLARTRFLLGRGLHRPDGRPVFPDDSFWEQPGELLDAVMNAYAGSRLDEATYRELARNEPWRSLWTCRKAGSDLFGRAAADYTDEQRALVSFAQLYDNIQEHPECPDEEVIADDDLLDGWLIDQRRKRVKKASAADLIGNEKIRNSQEVFLVAETREDAEKVMSLNDEYARAVQRRRFAALAEKGSLNECDMPDSKQRLAAQKAFGGRR